MKNLLFLPLLFSLCFAQSFQKYQNRTYNFSIETPETWTLQENVQSVVMLPFVAYSPMENGSDFFRENVNMVLEEGKGAMGVAAYYQANMQGMENMLKGFQEYEYGDIKLGKTPAKWLIYSHTANQMPLKVLVYFVCVDGDGYVITCSAEMNKFEQFQPTFEKMVSSLRFK